MNIIYNSFMELSITINFCGILVQWIIPMIYAKHIEEQKKYCIANKLKLVNWRKVKEVNFNKIVLIHRGIIFGTDDTDNP